jgi:hypothetical protein
VVRARVRETCAGERRRSALSQIAAGNDHRGVHIDGYGFGTLVVDGRQIHADVLVMPGGVRERWWRREGHVLHLEDLGALLGGELERLVVGTGAYGRMRAAAGLEEELAALGVSVEVLPTAAAVARINDLLGAGAAGWAGASDHVFLSGKPCLP